jgi:tetratricopeptide (TPR) repeat protein
MFGDYKQAMDVFNSVVRNNPNYPNVYSIAGDVSYSVGQLDQAYSMYTRLAELSEEDSIWLLNSNKIYIPMGKYQLAQQNVDHLRKAEMEGYAGKLDYLQASIWLASGDLESFNHWTESFKEDTQEDNERFWRGFSSMNQQKWKFAIEDLSKTLSIMRKDKPSIISEHTIRIQLYLARAYQALGNKLKSTNFLNIASDEIQHLNSEGFNSQRTRYQQAALAALKGEQHQAISLLRQSVQEGFVDFWWTKVDPSFYNVRKDPTYITIKDEFNIRMKLMQNSIESQYGKLSAGA